MFLWFEANALGSDRPAFRSYVHFHFEGFVLEDFAARLAAGGENFPPEQSRAGGQSDRCVLREAGAGERN